MYRYEKKQNCYSVILLKLHWHIIKITVIIIVYLQNSSGVFAKCLMSHTVVTNRFKVSFNSAVMKVSPKLDGIHVLELETLQATLKISTIKTEPKPTTFLATLEISWAAQNIDQNMLDLF